MPEKKSMASNAGAIAEWAAMVNAEHEQTDRVRTDDPNADSWKNLAHRFTPAERSKAYQDATLLAVMKFVRPEDTVMDVGAGAGRLAVPLAENCRRVIAVEPSEAMRARLAEQAKAWGVSNLEIIDARWPEWPRTEPASAEVVICAHVIYTTQEIEPFLRALTQASTRDVIVIVFEEPAMANYLPLWELVYGDERIALPSLSELKDVLQQMTVTYDTIPLVEWKPRPFADAESAYEESMTRLFLSPGSDGAKKLASVLPDQLIPGGDGLRFRWARPHRPWLVRWSSSERA